MPQQVLLPVREKLVTPFERRRQCPLARRRSPPSRRHQPKAVVQASYDLLKANRCGTCRCKLDCQRCAIQVIAYGCNKGQVDLTRREVRVQSSSPGDEKLNGAVLKHDL